MRIPSQWLLLLEPFLLHPVFTTLYHTLHTRIIRDPQRANKRACPRWFFFFFFFPFFSFFRTKPYRDIASRIHLRFFFFFFFLFFFTRWNISPSTARWIMLFDFPPCSLDLEWGISDGERRGLPLYAIETCFNDFAASLKINSVTTNHHRLPLPPSSSFIVKAGRIVGTGREIASRMSSETHRKPITLQLHPRRELIDKNFPFGLSLSSFSLFPRRERERQKETANETILASYFEWESARIKRDRA